VRGVLDAVTGPGGRDGYIHIADARELLRMEKGEAMEIAIRLKDFDQLDAVSARLLNRLNTEVLNKEDKPVSELHLWSDLSPFATIVKMIALDDHLHSHHAGVNRIGERDERDADGRV